MGPLFVLVFWIVVAGVLSVLGGVLLAGVAGSLLRGVEAGRTRAMLFASILPAIGFAYLFGCVLLFSLWSAARGRDWGWGDTWDTPILGSYYLMMIDVTDKATMYNRSDPSVYRNGSVSGSPEQKDVVFGVRRVEVRPPYLIGAASPDTFMEEPVKSPETLFFILDTRDGSRADEPSLAALESAAEKLGGPLKLEPVDAVYNRHRYRAIDLVPVTVFAIPPLIAFILLTRAFLKLRATRLSPAQSQQ